MLEWDDQNERYFHHGCDRGVLYADGLDPVVWNGITGVRESGNGTSTMYYIDGRVYLADVDPTDFSGSLTAYAFPDEFARCMGMPEIADGLIADNQKPKRFNLSYRTLIGSGLEGDMFGYQIHLIYKAMASISPRQRKTLSAAPAPMEFEFDMVATPVALPGFRPTAHYVIDTRHLDAGTIAALEEILYGDGETPGQLPEPEDLYDLLNFGTAITFTTFEHDTLGLCWRAVGAYANVHMTSPTTWEILNVNGTDHMDGTYTLEDTP